MDFYDLHKNSKKHIGKAIIFNNYWFWSSKINKFKPRLGSDNDVVRITESLKKLGFDVENAFINLLAKDMKDTIQIYAKKTYFEYSSFACVIMSHGFDNYEICDSEWDYAHLIKDFVAPFTECVSLKGKPKWFLVNACRGDEDFELVDVNQVTSNLRNFKLRDGLHTNHKQITEVKIDDTDVLIHFSSIEDKPSFRHKTGAYFIHTVCHVLDTYAMRENVDLVHLLRMVNNIAASWFEIQLPQISDNLRKFLSFNLNKSTLSVLGNESR
jgi:hypothetical protein